MLKISIKVLVVFSMAVSSFSQKPNIAKGHWDGGLPLKPSRVIEFTTDEGTNMSIDMSPDGRTIVFDLLGDLYLLPIGGGEAKPLTSGIAFDSAPRFSPDGKQIAFVSDRSGLTNIWTIGADGSSLRRVSNYTNVTDPRSPSEITNLSWSHEGQLLVASPLGPMKYRTPQLSNGVSGHIWRYKLDGRAEDLTPSITDHAGAVAVSPDGRSILYTAGKIWSTSGERLVKSDLRTGQEKSFKISKGDISSIGVTPDGNRLIYLIKVYKDSRPICELRIRDLGTDDPIDSDVVLDSEGVQSDHKFANVARPFAITPDSRSIIYTSNGKIKRLDLDTKQTSEIPFRAKVRAELGPLVPTPTWEFTGPLKVKQLRSVNSTADGKTTVFSALGKIWKQAIGAKPKRLTAADQREYDPVLSPDGSWIAFVTWSHHQGGKLWKLPTAGGEPIELAASSEAFSTPRWTPDGSELVALRIKAEQSMNGFFAERSTLIRLKLKTGQIGEIAPALDAFAHGQSLPLLTVSNDGQRVYFMTQWLRSNDPDPDALSVIRVYSVGLDGTDLRLQARISGYGTAAAASPDGKWLAIHNSYNIFILPFPQQSGEQVPVIEMMVPKREPTARQITIDGGSHPMWSADGKYLTWYWANQMFRLPYEEAIARTGPVKPRVTTVDLTVPRYTPKGSTFLTNARIITMEALGSPTYEQFKGQPMPTDPKVIERGDILLEGARIKAVGPSGTVRAPKDAKVVALEGKTIVPGYIATHEHRLTTCNCGGALLAEEEPFYISFLAEGFTTNQDPWFGYSPMYADEMVEAGQLTGPRWVGGLNGTILAGGGRSGETFIADYAAAEALVRRHKNSGAFLIKEYGQPHRIQRQWLAIAAAKHGIRMAGEVFEYPNHVGKVFDGWSMFQHELPGFFAGSTPRGDVRELLKRAGSAFEVHVQTRALAQNSRRQELAEIRKWLLQGFYPPSYVKAQLPRVQQFDEALITGVPRPTQSDKREVSFFAEMLRGGLRYGVGSDSKYGPVAVHFIAKNLGLPGGMTNSEILRMLTLNGARALGMETDIGSIEPGKMADLVILNSNPLDDFSNARDIKYVVKSGEVYDFNDEYAVLWPEPRKLTRFPWMPKPGDSTAASKLP